MILRTANAVFLMRDGFTGKTLTDGSAMRCLLDGRPLRRPIWKRDGYLVLTDLAPGAHTLSILRNGYREEQVRLDVRDGGLTEDTISLKPGAGYPFPRGTVRVSLALRRGRSAAAEERVWLGVRPRTRLRLAQDRIEAGDAQAHLFCEGNASLLPVPGHFLLTDPKAPELVYLRSLCGEAAEFAPPPRCGHVRGTELIPMQPYDADAAGCVQILLREPGTLTGFCAGSVYETALDAGTQTIEWNLEDKANG